MRLKLHRPLIFFDIESTGLDVSKDRIVEICLLRVMPDNSQTTKSYRLNPEIPIPKHITKIHGISNEDVAGAPVFKQVAKEILQFIGNGDFCGYNLYRFDVPMLMEEFLRCDIDLDLTNRKIIDVQRIFHKMEKRDLAAAYKFYCDKDLTDAHSAEADTVATFEVLLGQMERYEELNDTVDELYEFTGSPGNKMVDFAGRLVLNEKGEICFNFGKYRGKTVELCLKNDPNYYHWMMNGDFPAHTKKKLTEIRLKLR